MDSRAVVVFVVLVATFCMCVEAQAAATQPPKKELKCFDCKGCGDPFNKTKFGLIKKTCSSNEFFCYKFTHPDKKVDRGCTMKMDECPITGKDCLTCNVPECNSGRSLYITSTLPLITIITTLAAVLSAAVWGSDH